MQMQQHEHDLSQKSIKNCYADFNRSSNAQRQMRFLRWLIPKAGITQLFH